MPQAVCCWQGAVLGAGLVHETLSAGAHHMPCICINMFMRRVEEDMLCVGSYARVTGETALSDLGYGADAASGFTATAVVCDCADSWLPVPALHLQHRQKNQRKGQLLHGSARHQRSMDSTTAKSVSACRGVRHMHVRHMHVSR